MQKNKSAWTLRVITLAIFWLIAIMSWWKVIERGPALPVLVPAVCFAVAAIILSRRFIRVTRAHSRSNWSN